MQEIRCSKCNKLLGKISGVYEIKCPRCREMNECGVPSRYTEQEAKLLRKNGFYVPDDNKITRI